MERQSVIEKITAFFLLILLVLAVFPMEQPGMLSLWYGIEPHIIFQAKFMRLTVLEVVLGAAFVTSYLSWSSMRRVRYRNHFGPILILFALCIVWGYIGSFLGDDPIGLDNLGTGNWKKLAYGLVLFVILTLYLDSRKKIYQVLFAIALACVLLDIYGLGRYVLFGGIRTEKYIGNVVFWETVKLSLNVFVFVLATGFLFFPDRPLGFREKLLYRMALIMTLAVIFLSSRRTSMIMVMVAGGIYLWMLFRSGRLTKAIALTFSGGVLVILVVLFNYEAFETKFLSRLESIKGVISEEVEVDAGSTQGHVQELITGWEIVKANPVWGVGFAWKEDSGVAGGAQTERFWVHNSVLTFWMRFGILGVITYLYLYYKILTVLWRASRRSASITPFIFFTWFVVEFLSGLFFPPFFGYFKSSALFFGSLAIANAFLNTADKATETQRAPDDGREARPVRILRAKSGKSRLREA